MAEWALRGAARDCLTEAHFKRRDEARVEQGDCHREVPFDHDLALRVQQPTVLLLQSRLELHDITDERLAQGPLVLALQWMGRGG